MVALMMLVRMDFAKRSQYLSYYQYIFVDLVLRLRLQGQDRPAWRSTARSDSPVEALASPTGDEIIYFSLIGGLNYRYMATPACCQQVMTCQTASGEVPAAAVL